MKRVTKETTVELLWRPKPGKILVQTGVGFLDHMLDQLAFHSGSSLVLNAKGDLEVDAHHTVEDVALAFGEEVSRVLGDRSGLTRFGWAYAPLEDALARSVVDLVRRPWASVKLGNLPPMLGAVPSEMVPHFFRSFAMSAQMTLHVEVLSGENGHHQVEAAFKATALALAQALFPAPLTKARSTKGRL